MSWAIEFTIQCPFCSCRLHSQRRSPDEVAQSLANHLRHYHRPKRGEEE